MNQSRKFTKIVSLHLEEANLDADHSIWTKEEERDEYIDKVANNIGRVIIEFNLLEYTLLEILKSYLCETVYTSSLMFSLVSEKTFSQRVDVLKEFYKQIHEERKHEYDDEMPDFDEKFNRLINDLKEAGGLRNKYAHSFWHTVNEDRIVEFKSEIDKQGTKVISVRFSDEDMESDFELLQNIQVDLYNFNSEFASIYESS